MLNETVFMAEIPWIKSGAYLVYAPLADMLFVANRQFAGDLKKAMKEGTGARQVMETVSAIREQTVFPPMNEEMQFSCLTILPTNRCNFNCEYCYAARSRETSQQTISSEDLTNCLNLFLKRLPNDVSSIAVTFYGGGEPLLAWDRIVETMHFMNDRFEGKKYYQLITNGSLLEDDIISCLKKNNMDLAVSFDILPDIQNRQRGHYDLVAGRLEKCIESGLVPQINAVITPDNVNRMTEMIDYASSKWSRIRFFHFEPVISQELFPDPRCYHDFLSQFQESFFQTLERLQTGEKELTCSFYKKLSKTACRFCPVDFVITPYGEISSCACVSSPQIEDYHFYLYGKKGKSSVELDTGKYKQLLNHNATEYAECQECISRWNCAGSCLHRRRTMGLTYNHEFCRFMKNFTIRGLVHKLDSQYKKDYGKSLKELLMVSGAEHE